MRQGTYYNFIASKSAPMVLPGQVRLTLLESSQLCEISSGHDNITSPEAAQNMNILSLRQYQSA